MAADGSGWLMVWFGCDRGCRRLTSRRLTSRRLTASCFRGHRVAILVLAALSGFVGARADFSSFSARWHQDLPRFVGPMSNVSVQVGREATLVCVVENLLNYKVAWLQVDTQTILTIHGNVITKNNRIAVSQTDERTWLLHIRDVRESDAGSYMCQINTDPMASQIVHLSVVVPPDILDYPTSPDTVVREGANVTLRCAASGSPKPTVQWRREDGRPIKIDNVTTLVEGPMLAISRVDRLSMGAYFCIASNGVPPTVSKRINLIVHFPPMIHIANQLVGAVLGQTLVLECESEAYPKSINFWMKGDHIVTTDSRVNTTENGTSYMYTVIMRLTIRNVRRSDFDSYKCVSKNSLGGTDGVIRVEDIAQTHADLGHGNVIIHRSNKDADDRKYLGVGGRDSNEIQPSRGREKRPNRTRGGDFVASSGGQEAVPHEVLHRFLPWVALLVAVVFCPNNVFLPQVNQS